MGGNRSMAASDGDGLRSGSVILLLHLWKVIAIVPPQLSTTRDYYQIRKDSLRYWVRGGLVLIAGGLLAVFGIAIRLDPYRDGRVWLQETHRQLWNLPPCTFKTVTGLPCPSCGMTSSFALLMHGDIGHSLQANFVGTLLAVFLLVLIPWSLACAVMGRWLFVGPIEWALVRVVLAFLVLLLLRWMVVLLLAWTAQGS
jgi:hypothetical protein